MRYTASNEVERRHPRSTLGSKHLRTTNVDGNRVANGSPSSSRGYGNSRRHILGTIRDRSRRDVPDPNRHHDPDLGDEIVEPDDPDVDRRDLDSDGPDEDLFRRRDLDSDGPDEDLFRRRVLDSDGPDEDLFRRRDLDSDGPDEDLRRRRVRHLEMDVEQDGIRRRRDRRHPDDLRHRRRHLDEPCSQCRDVLGRRRRINLYLDRRARHRAASSIEPD